MKAVVYEKQGCVRLTDVPMPRILEPRDAIVKVMRASICSSDLHIRNGGVPRAKTGVVLGHEFVGEGRRNGFRRKKGFRRRPRRGQCREFLRGLLFLPQGIRQQLR